MSVVLIYLEPVNTDPVLSPKKKRSSTASKPEKKPTSKSSRGRLTITRSTPSEIPPLHLPEPVQTTEINLEDLPPKTPAAEAIFSPPSTEPSSSQPETKDTPPPGDINQSDQTGLGTRPSRRARPQVSYKEPSLNTKMRRPGKELVDAVVTNRRTSVEPTSAMKRESGESSSTWKPLTTTSAKSTEDMEVGSPLREKLGRRDGSQATENAPEPPKLNSSAASSAISALISATSTKRKTQNASSSSTNEAQNTSSKAQTETSQQGNLAKATEKAAKPEEKDSLAIFDFTDSSPNDPPLSRARDLAKAGKNARRHSALPASSSTSSSAEDKEAYTKAKDNGILPSLGSRVGSNGAIRSTSTSSLNRSSSTSSKLSSAKEKKTSASTSTSTSTQVDAQTGNLRAERAASRRKSMMI